MSSARDAEEIIACFETFWARQLASLKAFAEQREQVAERTRHEVKREERLGYTSPEGNTNTHRGRATSLANTAVFIASDRASGLTGTTVNLTLGALDD